MSLVQVRPHFRSGYFVPGYFQNRPEKPVIPSRPISKNPVPEEIRDREFKKMVEDMEAKEWAKQMSRDMCLAHKIIHRFECDLLKRRMLNRALKYELYRY